MAQEKKDNSSPDTKMRLRQKFLPGGARVLDLYCGTGEMYRLVYEGRVDRYHGVDAAKVFDTRLCSRQGNMDWLEQHGCSGFNVIDLDSYRNPYPQLKEVLKLSDQDELHIFLTDGLGVTCQRNSSPIRLHAWSECISMDFHLPGYVSFLKDITCHLLVRIFEQSDFELVTIVHINPVDRLPRLRKQMQYIYVFAKRMRVQ